MKKWVDDNYIDNFIEKYNYDIRLSHNGRWIDQKCTPDVLSFVSDCIIEFLSKNNNKSEFNTNDIWFFDYSINNAVEAFNKPRPDTSAAKNEYDKFFGQPLKLLGYSKVLIEVKKHNQNYYRVNDFDLLEYLSLREVNALNFIQKYSEKVLKDSHIFQYFEKFFEFQDKESFEYLKSTFTNFTKKYTSINGNVEASRIFTKIINPLAFKYDSCGTVKGRLSKEPITLDMLMYNNDNFRDIYLGKPKSLTRSEYCLLKGIKYNEGYSKYSSEKAKRFIRVFNDSFRNGVSEVNPTENTGPAINMHHIFPECDFPEISGYVENLIALTPNQHYIEAHPMGNTKKIDKNYQIVCLLTKAQIIYDCIKSHNTNIYNLKRFLYVLRVGFDDEEFLKYNISHYNDLLCAINHSI